MNIWKILLALVVSISVISCNGGGSNSSKDPDDTEPTRTVQSVTDAELYEVAKASTVRIIASGLKYNIDGSNNQNWWGSGFFISDNGYIVTNNHVVTGAGQLEVEVDGTSLTYPAEVIGVAECSDLAVIKLTYGSGFPSLSWYENRLEPNMPVVAAGFPGDVYNIIGKKEFTMNKGDIGTAPGRQGFPWSFVEEAVIHSAQISGGNSGGPLFEKNTGRVAGVNYAGSSSRYLAIANTTAKPLVERMIQGENIKSIGASLELVFFNDGRPAGVFVKAVQAGGKASAIGIKVGDIIRQIGNVPLFLTNQETQSTVPQKYTLEKYCSVLATNNPNNPNDPNDKGKVIEIVVERTGEVCTGEINGKKLQCLPTGNIGGGGDGNGDGGGDNSSGGTETTIRGALKEGDFSTDDGILFDVYAFVASETGTATIGMSSEELDAVLIITDVKMNVLASDDDGGSGTDALVKFDVTKDENYYVLAAQQSSNHTGSYTLNFSANLSNITEVNEK